MTTNTSTPAVNKPQINGEENNSISMMDLLHLCFDHWKWFVLSLLVSMTIMGFYILCTIPEYTRSAEILLKQDERGRNVTADASTVLTEMGLANGASNITNEIYTLNSPSIILDVVKRLKLDINYLAPGTFHKRPLYGTTLPVTVSFPEIGDSESASFTLKIEDNGNYTISKMKFCGDEIDGMVTGKLEQTVKTPMGKIVIKATPSFKESEDREIYVSRRPLEDTAKGCIARLTVGQANKQATVISLSYRDVTAQRAKEVLTTIIATYNENWVKEKNLMAVATSAFIDERLEIIEKELGNVDSDISSYKSSNLITDLQAAAELTMRQATEAEKETINLNNQLYMARYIRNYLANDANRYQLLPSNSGIESQALNSIINTYNEKLLQRNSLVANSSESNPLVVTADAALVSQRQAILHSIDNVIETLNSQIHSLQHYQGKANSQIASAPGQAKHLLSVERQQKVKEALYLFLLQKREENELSQSFTAYNTRIISPASGSKFPTSPVKARLMLIAFAIGLAIPFGIIYLIENTNTRIRGRHDLDGKTSMPFLGEIPYYGKKVPTWKFWKKQKEDSTKTAVREGSRNVINEAFRVLRTNIEFMMASKPEENVITITSYNPGSGKSFLTMNLAISFAIKRKRILVIDGDLRHGSTSQYVNRPKVGLSDFLSGNVKNLEDIIVTDARYKTLDVIPIGTIPPNPTELLYTPLLKETIDSMRSKYDYIFIDCPPADIVADTAIIEKHADRTIFIIRAGLLERAMLTQLESDYQSEKFKNMSLILNGTESNGGRYRYQYGYKYGYHSYGYYGHDE